MRGYVVREDNAWKLAIFNGVHNHEMVPYVAGHLLARRLTDSSVKPKNILTNLKNKRKESMTNIKQIYNERHKFKKAKRGDLTEMQFLISKLEENGRDRNKYIEIYASEHRYNYILDGLHPPKNASSFAPPDKWLTLPDMGYIVETCYNRPVLEMTTIDIGVSKTFFPLRGRPPVNPKTNMICVGLIPNHFVLLNLKDGCPLPPSSTE